GVPVLQAFQVVAESIKKPAMSGLVQELMNDVAAGASFSDALKRHPQHFVRLRMPYRGQLPDPAYAEPVPLFLGDLAEASKPSY
ncbi:type II secretion system F family protein, partial [Mycobacterium tuberculosis]|uniref:type II secretion system F family protein n=1 Tax=Mycobacterium tuberculosis TaxID=1773 RepID=UPI003EB7973B